MLKGNEHFPSGCVLRDMDVKGRGPVVLIYWHIEYLLKILEIQNYIRGVHTNWNSQYLNRICGLMEWNDMIYQNLMIYRFINLKSCYLNQFSHMPCEWKNCSCNFSGIYSVALRSLVSSVCVLLYFVFLYFLFYLFCPDVMCTMYMSYVFDWKSNVRVALQNPRGAAVQTLLNFKPLISIKHILDSSANIYWISIKYTFFHSINRTVIQEIYIYTKKIQRNV